MAQTAETDDFASEYDHLTETRARVLAAALPNVPFDGWTQATLRAAVTEAGVDADLAKLAFPRGAIDLAVAFHRDGDRRMLARLRARLDEDGEMRIRDKITYAVRARLEAMADHKEAVRRAAALFALPVYTAEGAGLIWGTADAIWEALGDPSRDYNWHTKRLTLSGVYSATVLYWLGDLSEDHHQTWAFLDRRIDDVMRIEKTKAALRKNPVARLALTGPRFMLSMLKAPPRKGEPVPGASVGLPG